MTPEQLTSIAGILVVLLGVSESLPFISGIKSNSWGQLIIAALRAIASKRRG